MRRPDRPTVILAIICLSYFMVILDNSIIFTGLPRIEAAMEFTPTGLTWVQDAYTLVFGGLLLLGARSGDIVGRRRMFVAGLALFSVASLLVGLAPYAWWLIAARAFQGIGAAILAPSSLSLLTASFPEGHQRAKAVAAYAAVAGIGASAGLVVGGVLADLVSWRAGFFLNVPIGIAMALAAYRFIGETERRRGRFDLLGALCATFGMTALVYGIVESTVPAIVLGVVLLAALVVNEARAEQPIMPLRLFTDRRRTGAYLIRMFYLGAMIGFFFFTSQYLQGVLGFGPLRAGLAFLPMSAVNFAVAMLVNRVLRRFGTVPVLAAGVAITLTGMAWLSRADAGSAYLTAVALPMVLIGIGQGLAFAPMTSAGLAGVDAADAGAASGLVNTFHQVGSALGLAVLATVGGGALVDRVSAALTGGTVLLAVALLLVGVIAVRPRRRTTDNVSAEAMARP